MIKSNPCIPNKIPYTIAVIKEVLRIYPATSDTRTGEPNFSATDGSNRNFPTDGFLVWDDPHASHGNSVYWPRPDDFLPEQWLVAASDPLHPIKEAWRPFSRGPRNCIGQEVAMTEMKLIMVMTGRRFDIQLAYEDLDRAKGTANIKTVYEERGYQIQRAQRVMTFRAVKSMVLDQFRLLASKFLSYYGEVNCGGWDPMDKGC